MDNLSTLAHKHVGGWPEDRTLRLGEMLNVRGRLDEFVLHFVFYNNGNGSVNLPSFTSLIQSIDLTLTATFSQIDGLPPKYPTWGIEKRLPEISFLSWDETPISYLQPGRSDVFVYLDPLFPVKGSLITPRCTYNLRIRTKSWNDESGVPPPNIRLEWYELMVLGDKEKKKDRRGRRFCEIL